MLPSHREVVEVLRETSFSVEEMAPGSPSVRRRLDDVRVSVEASGGNAAIAVPDHTKPVPVEDVLDLLVLALEGAGVEREAITVIFATGTHEMRMEEAMRMGKWLGKLKFKVHDRRAPHEYVGTTRHGLRVEVDEDFAAADVRVTVGIVAPHP